MKALSIKQPWAHLILHGGKDIENRSRRSHFEGRFLVHAGLTVDEEALYYFTQEWYQNDIDYIKKNRGVILGSVEMVGCVEKSESKWFQGPFGYVLKDPIVFANPTPWKGQLNFFEVDESKIDRTEISKWK